MDERLDFSQNWNNKLGCSSFTAIRLHNPRKYCAGARMNIYLKNYWKGTATVLQVETATLGNINERIARQDTDLTAEEFRRLIRTMYKNRPGIDWDTQQLDILLLRYDKESKEPTLKL